MRPDFSGRWCVDLANSLFRGATPRELTVEIDHREPSIVQRITLMTANGTEQRLTFAFRTDGAESSNATPNGEAKVRAHWRESMLLVETTLHTSDHTLSFRDHWRLAEDRQTLSMAHPDDDLAGQIAVLNRVPN